VVDVGGELEVGELEVGELEFGGELEVGWVVAEAREVRDAVGFDGDEVGSFEVLGAARAASLVALAVDRAVPKQSRSIATRNAESVLPDPVGASSNVDAPDAIAGQPFVCATVGASNDASNQTRVARFAKARAEVMGSRGWHVGVTSTRIAESRWKRGRRDEERRPRGRGGGATRAT